MSKNLIDVDKLIKDMEDSKYTLKVYAQPIILCEGL